MLKKKTFSQFTIKVNIDSLKKKLLNLNLYNKSFLMSNSLFKSEKIILINNYSNESSIIKNNYKSKNIIGSSVNSKYTNFSNNTFDPIRFRLNSLSLNHNTSFLNSLYDSFNLFFNEQNKLKYFIILKPIKGGFKTYCSGFIGFVPRKHMSFIIDKILTFFFINNFNIKKIVKLKDLLLKNPFTLFRLPFVEYKFIVYINYFKHKKFVFFKYKRRRRKINNLNVVFLTKISKEKTLK